MARSCELLLPWLLLMLLLSAMRVFPAESSESTSSFNKQGTKPTRPKARCQGPLFKEKRHTVTCTEAAAHPTPSPSEKRRRADEKASQGILRCNVEPVAVPLRGPTVRQGVIDFSS